MKICYSKAMKMIKEYEAQKQLLLDNEITDSVCTYTETEKRLTGDYDYAKTRTAASKLDDQIRQLRVALAQANTTTIIDGFNITIGEALILLAQLVNRKEHFDRLSNCQQISRRITTNGVVEYTERLYDVKKLKKDAALLREQISNLQIAIDRANLTSFIEI